MPDPLIGTADIDKLSQTGSVARRLSGALPLPAFMFQRDNPRVPYDLPPLKRARETYMSMVIMWGCDVRIFHLGHQCPSRMMLSTCVFLRTIHPDRRERPSSLYSKPNVRNRPNCLLPV